MSVPLTRTAVRIPAPTMTTVTPVAVTTPTISWVVMTTLVWVSEEVVYLLAFGVLAWVGYKRTFSISPHDIPRARAVVCSGGRFR